MIKNDVFYIDTSLACYFWDISLEHFHIIKVPGVTWLFICLDWFQSHEFPNDSADSANMKIQSLVLAQAGHGSHSPQL